VCLFSPMTGRKRWRLSSRFKHCWGEGASDARQQDCRGFSDAPHRTRRAPFDTHRALHRCSRVDRTALVPEPIRCDADRSQRRGNHIAVAPTKRASSGPMPPVLPRQIPHASTRMPPSEPFTAEEVARYRQSSDLDPKQSRDDLVMRASPFRPGSGRNKEATQSDSRARSNSNGSILFSSAAATR
jgi:hypothetical protein